MNLSPAKLDEWIRKEMLFIRMSGLGQLLQPKKDLNPAEQVAKAKCIQELTNTPILALMPGEQCPGLVEDDYGVGTGQIYSSTTYHNALMRRRRVYPEESTPYFDCWRENWVIVSGPVGEEVVIAVRSSVVPTDALKKAISLKTTGDVFVVLGKDIFVRED